MGTWATVVTRSDDSLLQCLLALCRVHGNATTAEAVLAGLPLQDGRLSPGLFERAASRAGLTARIVPRKPSEIEHALLPAVLLLEGERACLLMGWQDGQAQVIYPELNEAVVSVSADALSSEATGSIILCRPRFQFDARAPQPGEAKGGHWFWDAIRANTPIYRDVFLAAFFINLFALALPLFTMNVYDRVVPNHATETLWMLAAGVIIVLLADLVLRTMRGYFLDLASRRVDVRLSSQIMEKVLGIRLENRPKSVGSYAVNLRSFETVRDFIASASVTTLIDIPFAVLFLAVIAWIAWPVLVPVLIGLAIVLGYALTVQRRLKSLAETTYRAGALRNATLIEGLVGLETVKAMGGEARIQRRWEETTGFLARVGVQLRLLSNSAINTTLWGQQMVAMFVIITGVYLITQGELSMGGLIACTMIAGRVMAPFGQLAGLITQYHNARIALDTLEGVMDQPVERPPGAKFLSRELFSGDLEFKHVSFTYPGADVPSLDGVSFSVKAGEKVAILGRVGSGKSTLQKLCMGLYQPSSGAVLVDGIDLRQLDPSELRARIGYVPQDVTLFYGSLRDNLTLGNDQVTDGALVEAADIAGLTEFINRHPQGFDMQVGERGEALSGGQRKSVALARGIVSEPPILLMDEPTGSMDHSTESAVKRKLAGFVEGRTWLVVTHRNSLLEMVDRIIVIDHGKLVADGPRDSVVQALQQGRIGKAQ
ncbi:MAG: type I secretion system permease/ATPase [Pseudomonadota bacterium]